MTAPHVLLVGDDSDLPALRQIVAGLPADAYGQIFVEIATARPVPVWEAPPGVSVTWLRRELTSDPRDILEPSGLRAARAVLSWVSEWVPEGRGEETSYVLWIGCASSAHIDYLYRHLAHRFENLHLHHPHG